jgi:hypothetical protein
VRTSSLNCAMQFHRHRKESSSLGLVRAGLKSVFVTKRAATILLLTFSGAVSEVTDGNRF